MPDGLEVPRYHFGLGLAVEPVRDDTYRWVDPITGQHRGYIVATRVDYLPTIEQQRLYKGNK